MATKDEIIRLLTGTVARRIRFKVSLSTGSITINKAAFGTVASAIGTGKIKVTTTTTFDPGVGAEYHTDGVPDATSGTLRIPPICGREQEGMVMHECMHAFFDLKKIDIRATEEEAICYLVNALYFRMTGLTPTRWNNEPHKTAKAVADGLLHQYAIGTSGVPAVDANTWRVLVFAVAVNPTYFLDVAGLPRWFHGSDGYAHDG